MRNWWKQFVSYESRRPVRADAGFTLVEVLLALFILLVALLALANLFIVSMKLNATSHDETTATALAQEKLEEMKRIPYEDLDNTSDQGASLPTENESESCRSATNCATDNPITTWSDCCQNYDVDGDGVTDYVLIWRFDDDVVIGSAVSGLFEFTVRAKYERVIGASIGKRQLDLSTYRADDGT
jgi:type IV pilus modification protein PilV